MRYMLTGERVLFVGLPQPWGLMNLPRVIKQAGSHFMLTQFKARYPNHYNKLVPELRRRFQVIQTLRNTGAIRRNGFQQMLDSVNSINPTSTQDPFDQFFS